MKVIHQDHLKGNIAFSHHSMKVAVYYFVFIQLFNSELIFWGFTVFGAIVYGLKLIKEHKDNQHLYNPFSGDFYKPKDEYHMALSVLTFPAIYTAYLAWVGLFVYLIYFK